jgi:hypothetical protein
VNAYGSRMFHAAGTLVVTSVLCVSLSAPLMSDERSDTLQVSEQLQRLITDITRETIPHDYENEKQWGKKKDAVRGLYIKREGLRIKTHRTTEAVNHGTWTKYRVELLDPEQYFQVRLQQVHALPNNRLAFDILCDARVRIFGRLSQWQQGIQLISLGAEADATVQVVLQCDLATRLDTSTIPPGLEFDPVVRQADLQIKDFRVRRISQVNGPLVKALSASVREMLEDEIEHRRAKLLAQINRQIDKRRDKLRLSLGELFAPSSKSASLSPPTEEPGKSTASNR